MSRVQPVSPIQLSSSPPSPTLRAVSSSSALFQPTLHTYPGLEPSSNHLIPLRSHHRRNKSYDERTHISSGGTHPSMQRVYSIEYKRSVSPRPVEVLATSSPLARQVATTPQLELRIRLRIDGCNKLLAGKLGTKRNPYVVVYVVERIQQLLYGNFETRIDHLRASRHGPGPLRAKYITAVRKRTRNPRWEGEDFDIPLKSQTDMGLYIEVFDHSQLHSDSFLGSASLTIPQILDIVDRTSDSHVDLELEGTQRSTTLLKKSLPVSGSVMVTVTSTASCKRLPSSPARSSSPSFSLTNSAELSSPLSAMATPPLYYPYTNLVWNTPNLQTFDILLFGDQLAPSHVAMVYKPNGSENQFSLVSSSSSSSEQISDAYLMFEFFSDPTDILTPAAVRLQSSAARLDAYFSPTNREFSPHRLVAARVLTGPRQASSLVRLETITHQLQGLDAAAAAALFPSLCQAELAQPTIQTSFSAQLIATIFRACGILSEETNPLECSPRDFGCFDGSKLKFMPGFCLEPEILHSFERLKTFAE